MRLGDHVLAVDSVPLVTKLSEALQGKESCELLVAVDTEGGEGGGDADGDGELDDGEDGAGWCVAQERVVAPLLCKRTPAEAPLCVGDDVFVMTGAWREAVVEAQHEEQYLLHFGKGERRWASGGEIAWHDLLPKPYDIAPAKAMLGWDEGAMGFQVVHVLRAAGSKWLVRFDSGSERRLAIGQMRERWALPLRVMGYWGDYHHAKVLEALAGLIRLDFGGKPRWALPEELLASAPPQAEELAVGGFVAVQADSTAETTMSFKRATIAEILEGERYILATEDGHELEAQLSQLRLPMAAKGSVAPGEEVFALLADWSPGIIDSLADSTVGERYPTRMSHEGRHFVTWLSTREIVARDGGDLESVQKLNKGAPVVVFTERWECALLFGPPTDGTAKVIFADGSDAMVAIRNVRPRIGDAHPVSLAIADAERRMDRYTSFSALVVQTRFRALLARRRARQLAEAAIPVQSKWRGRLARRRFLLQVHAAIRLQAAGRGLRGRQVAAAGRAAVEQEALVEAEVAAVQIQAAERGRQARNLAGVMRAEAEQLAAEAAAEEEAMKQAAATNIQAAERGRQARRRLIHQRASAVTLQAAVRRWLARRLAATLRSDRAIRQMEQLERERVVAATRLQAVARGRIARLQYLQLRCAAIVVQSRWRMRVQVIALRRAKRASTLVQAVARGRPVRRKYTEARAAAVQIQAAARRMLARQSLAAAVGSATLIAACARGMLARRRRHALQIRKHAGEEIGLSIVRIQKAARGMLARRELVRRRRTHAVTRIQARQRGRAARSPPHALWLQRMAAIRVQAAIRGLLARLGFKSTKRAVIRAQANFRRSAVRQRMRVWRKSAVCIQAAARGHAARLWTRRERAAIRIQAAQRRRRAQRQRAYLGHERSTGAATHLQRVARGHAARLLVSSEWARFEPHLAPCARARRPMLQLSPGSPAGTELRGQAAQFTAVVAAEKAERKRIQQLQDVRLKAMLNPGVTTAPLMAGKGPAPVIEIYQTLNTLRSRTRKPQRLPSLAANADVTLCTTHELGMAYQLLSAQPRRTGRGKAAQRMAILHAF